MCGMQLVKNSTVLYCTSACVIACSGSNIVSLELCYSTYSYRLYSALLPLAATIYV